MVFQGLADKEHESWNECQILLVHFLDEHMGLTNVQIERAHRSASAKTKRPATALVKDASNILCDKTD